MKNHESYRKYKNNYAPNANPIFSNRNIWRVALITVLAVAIEPFLFMSRYQRSVPFSMDYYFHLIKYFFVVAIPVVIILVWLNRREHAKRNKGYGWVGQFEVVHKQSSFVFRYLLLSPGNNNRIKVDHDLFEKVRVGDFIQIRRNAFGGVEAIVRVNNSSGRLARVFSRHAKAVEA